jgi:hypothetical protein
MYGSRPGRSIPFLTRNYVETNYSEPGWLHADHSTVMNGGVTPCYCSPLSVKVSVAYLGKFRKTNNDSPCLVTNGKPTVIHGWEIWMGDGSRLLYIMRFDVCGLIPFLEGPRWWCQNVFGTFRSAIVFLCRCAENNCGGVDGRPFGTYYLSF